MRKIVITVLLQFVWIVRCAAIEPAADPALATVRIKSHGASATIIATTEGRSWLLGCAHMLTDKHGNPSEAIRAKALAIDGPVQPYATKKIAVAKLLAWDYNLDLSLIEIGNGPFHFMPVARPGFQAGRVLWSCGYDEMRWPVTKKSATILYSQGDTTFTKEKPWHGRSGGGLADGEARVLIGVVQGYELYPNSRGLYVSHRAILTFLQAHWKYAPPPTLEEVVPIRRQRLQVQPIYQPFLPRYPACPGER
jgi:hypothetical protein